MFKAIQPSINLWDTPQKYNGWTDWTTWNVALWINNDQCYYNIAKDCKDYMDFLYEMQSMIGSFATPDGADWGEANIEEMNEVIMEAIYMLQIIKYLLSLMDILFPETIIRVVKQTSMFDNKLQPIYDGKVLVNQSAMDNPIVQSALAEMSKRNFEPQRINNYGIWYISDRH